MFQVAGKGSTHTCAGVTRRDFIHAGALSALGLSLPHYVAARNQGHITPGHDGRSVIMIFNLGAPSHIDTFDPKPDAPAEVRGPFRAIPTKVPGTQLSEILPRHAAIADRFSLVRSCYDTGPAVHDAGWQTMQTGRLFSGGINTPHAGCVTTYLMGRQRGTDLPGHVLLPEPMGRGGGDMPNGQEAGFLGKAHDPFALMADPSQPNFQVPDMLPPSEIGTVRLERRRRLRDIVDSTIKNFEASDNARLLDSNFHDAYRLMTSTQARNAFDLAQEPESMRQRYGTSRFGQCCLLARRLVESGVRFVTINTFLTVFDEITWDIHGSKPFTSIEGMKRIVAPMYDQAYSTLVEDLHYRGMLDDTLVCNVSEFGRTPKINPAGGRDHWPQCWTCYMAGGGIQGGRVVGSSDPIGGVPADRPVKPRELVATIFHSLGIDLETELPGPNGRPFPVVDFATREVEELF